MQGFIKITNCVTIGLVMAGLGCSSGRDHRVSLSQFIEWQNAAKETVSKRVSEDEYPINPDDYLGPYTVGAGDVLLVTVSGTNQDALLAPFDARTNREGNIQIPIVGSIAVGNRELIDAEEIIHDAYVPEYFQNIVVHVEIKEARTTDVLVTGAVEDPGFVPLRQHQRNMLYGIVGAGGATQAASGLATLRRIRKPGEEITLDLRSPFDVRRALALDPLEAGDLVHVHATPPNMIFVGGLVSVVGPQSYPAGTHVSILQAIAAAGGLRPDVSPREGTLIRRYDESSDVHVRLDLNRLACGKDPNIELAPGDILWVPHTWDTRIEEFISQNIFLRAGVTVSYNVTGREFLNRPRQQNADFGGGGGTLEGVVDPLGFLVPPPP